ncbi:uncharacterized protein FRV6_15833 [Fusarium oxysporum]|uniref:Ubiquitin-like domain-containing protein n=1 Tax=Fusarium oxysporum TaxID=5507 RepID=A0A2H3TVM7_FUSOX|nr:uncharacterized protein FRV6_15833 [Fusarium oxysporum]
MSVFAETARSKISMASRGLCRLLVVMFYNKPGLRLVERRRFVVMQSRSSMPIKPQDWSTSVIPGDSLNMSILLERLGSQSTTFSCPRCDHVFNSTKSDFQRGYQCPKCLLWSDTVDGSQLGISSYSSSLTVPVPPPEPVHWDSWNGQWRSRFRRPQALLRLRNSGMPFDKAQLRALRTKKWMYPPFAVFTSFHSRETFCDLLSGSEVVVEMSCSNIQQTLNRTTLGSPPR